MKVCFRCSAACALLLCAGQIFAANALWTVGTPATANNLSAITFGNNLFVAVGASGTLLTSANGSTWTAPIYAGTPNNLHATAYGNGNYVAVGDNGWTVTSTDGTHWTSAASGATLNNLRAVVYAAGKFVAVGDGGTIIVLTNGSWSAASYASGATDLADNLAAVTYGANRFVAAGADYDTCFVSTNGTSWTQTGNGLNDDSITGLAYGNGVFAEVDVFGGIFVSTDGSNWTARAGTGSALNAVTCSNGLFVAVGNSGALFISGGTNFWTHLQPPTVNNLSAIAYGNNLFVAVGANGTIASSSLASVNPTPPGINWALASYASGTSDSHDNLTSVANGGGHYVAVGYDSSTSFSSTNGVTWTQGGSGLSDEAHTRVVYGAGQFTEVDDYGSINTSAVGSSWIHQFGGAPGGLSAITWGQNQYVTVGFGGAAQTSPDGANWTTRNSGVTANLSGAAFAPGQHWSFIAVGDNGTILTSSNNGTNWTTQTSGATGTNLFAVTYAESHYVVVGDMGIILVSSNAQNWSVPANYFPAPDPLRAITCGDGLFVATGDHGWTAISPDTANWTSVSSASVNDLQGITYNAGLFVVVGVGGAIMDSLAPSVGIARPSKTSALLTVTGWAGQNCHVQYSTNFIAWTNLASLVLTNGAAQTTDLSATNRRFYRVTIP